MMVHFVEHIAKGKWRNIKSTSAFKMTKRFNKIQHKGASGRVSNPGVGVRKDLLSAIILNEALKDGWMLKRQIVAELAA